jgi:hypothetical protein
VLSSLADQGLIWDCSGFQDKPVTIF